MKTIFHPANERGKTELDWLNSKHSFSFGNYYVHNKVSWGTLLVLNDDSIKGGTGFGEHGHKNMEIISIPLKGKLIHKDSAGNEGTLSNKDVQMMSAGSGIRHSEFNGSLSEECDFLQIWIVPRKKNTPPRYEQKEFDFTKKNNLLPLASNGTISKTVSILQDAFIIWGNYEEGESITYTNNIKNNLLYVFNLAGKITIGERELQKRDALAIDFQEEENQIILNAKEKSNFLIFEIPRQ